MPLGSGGAAIQTAQVTLTAAQLKAAQAAFAYSIVPAQGSGTQIIPYALAAKYHFGTAAYLLGSSLDVGLASGGDATNNLVWTITAAFLLAAQDQTLVTQRQFPDNQFNSTTFENTRLAMTLGGAQAFTTGDGTLTLWVAYAVAAL